jgi:hypothetical protein
MEESTYCYSLGDNIEMGAYEDHLPGCQGCKENSDLVNLVLQLAKDSSWPRHKVDIQFFLSELLGPK